MINKIKHTRCGNELLLLFAVFCSTANAENFTSTFPNTNTSALYDGNNSTEVTKEDLENGVKDERGVLYSKDGKRLLKAPADLREYRVKDRTTVICDNAFKMEVGFGSNSELRKVVIPPSVTTIGNSVFTSCKNLENIEVETSNMYFISDGGILFTSDKKTLICFPAGKQMLKYAIPEGVTTIEKEAFCNCVSLESLTLPSTVTTIKEKAFFDCASVKAFDIPSRVTTIGKSAFRACINITSITVPQSVTSISDEVFLGCMSLKTVKLPQSIDSIGLKVFAGCRSLESIVIPRGTSEKFRSMLAENLHSKLKEE